MRLRALRSFLLPVLFAIPLAPSPVARAVYSGYGLEPLPLVLRTNRFGFEIPPGVGIVVAGGETLEIACDFAPRRNFA